MSAGNREIPISQLREAVEYNQYSGEILWKARPRHHFKSDRGWNSSNKRYAGKPAGTIRNDGYKVITLAGVGLYSHRVAFALHYGMWPKAELDHIDRNPQNNCIANLCEVSHAGNMRNQSRKKHNSSGITGISRNTKSGNWLAYIQDRGSHRHLGTFSCLAHAMQARKSAMASLGYALGHGT